MSAALSRDMYFTTAALAPKDRFDAFRNLMACVHHSVSFSAPDCQPFWCEMKIRPVRDLVVFRAQSAPLVTTVTPTSTQGEEILTVQVCAGGQVASEQRNHVTVSGGAGFVSPSTVAGQLSYTSHTVVNALVVPRNVLKPLVRDVWPDACADVTAAPAFRLLRGWLTSALELDAPIPHEITGLFSQTAIDLLALTLGVLGDERELVLGRGVPHALRQEILRRIKQKATCPGLSAKVIGHSLGITGRYVHRLLMETGKTFTEHMLEERLKRAHEMLSERAVHATRVTDIATAAGFTDISYFNRTFRRRFGETPSATRARLNARRDA